MFTATYEDIFLNGSLKTIISMVSLYGMVNRIIPQRDTIEIFKVAIAQ